ncbi:thioredoxin [Hymenobacter cellulosivorans]|uniref:Thioredoxin n=1 Tax=Hymenobacter cellulosivorans TaxID=2932249 RepID=A0ABY4F527_9BACT|nr:thioredoxin [Hymenobacter cellulosivorans]UOQ51153.1 thioredoxin [Hymenobacter cellulosivorans]
MPTSSSFLVRPTDAAVLLVLLPEAGAARPAPTALQALQRQLGAAVRVLRVEEARHPAVVHSFQATELPALVLVQQGVELWRQQGLPTDEALAPLLLSKLRPASRPIPQPVS